MERFPATEAARYLTYTCTISANTMFVDIEAALEIDAGIEVSDVVLTFAYDNMETTEQGARYEDIAVSFPDRPPLRRSAGGKERFEVAAAGAS